MGRNGDSLGARGRRTARGTRSKNGRALAVVLPIEDAGIRWDKVRNAQARIAVGYYDRDDVKRRILDVVVRELSRR